MKNRSLAGQLSRMKTQRAGGAPDAQWLLSTKETLLMQIKNTVGEAPSSSGFKAAFREVFRVFVPNQFSKMLIAPLAVLLLMVGADFGASAIISASKSSLPGQSLYSVKLLAEQVSLRFAGAHKAQFRLEIAGHRLDEMARLAASTDPQKDEKLARASSLFSDAMSGLRSDLNALRSGGDSEAAVRTALLIDTKTEEYQQTFNQSMLRGRPALRLALLGLDQTSVGALEILVEKQSQSPHVLPEAELTSTVGNNIDAFASHVADAEGQLIADKQTPPSSLLLTIQAKQAAEEAKTLWAGGDFQAAVRKVMEGTDLAAKAESKDSISSATSASATATPAADSATGAPASSRNPAP